MSTVLPLRVVDLTAQPAPVRPPVATLHRSLADGLPASLRRSALSPATTPAPRTAGALPGSLPVALRDIEGVRARLDDMLAQARSGRTFTPQELLGLQVDAHRFAQTVELAGRAVEHGVQGLRQALNAQV
ncbi:MAG TPA: hypothetical protein VFM45_02850 [Anaeromyxobacteraceae bacterium]|nr:hypothetical protein [Anaeromyxobacteraceae bacterium]